MPTVIAQPRSEARSSIGGPAKYAPSPIPAAQATAPSMFNGRYTAGRTRWMPATQLGATMTAITA